MAVSTTPDIRLSSLPPAAGRAGLRGALASEFTKIRLVRSRRATPPHATAG
jgi:hypothetical protein